MKRTFTLGICFLLLAGISAAAQQNKIESKEAKISRALSAAPANISKSAKVVDVDDKGRETLLREGANGFTCFPGHPGVVGDVAFCADAAALQWGKDFVENKPGTWIMYAGTPWAHLMINQRP